MANGVTGEVSLTAMEAVGGGGGGVEHNTVTFEVAVLAIESNTVTKLQKCIAVGILYLLCSPWHRRAGGQRVHRLSARDWRRRTQSNTMAVTFEVAVLAIESNTCAQAFGT